MSQVVDDFIKKHASGAQTGDRLGRVLMDAYVEFLRAQTNQLAVYFVGQDPKNPEDFSDAMLYLNAPKSRSAVYCMSFETQVAPYKTTVT